MSWEIILGILGLLGGASGILAFTKKGKGFLVKIRDRISAVSRISTIEEKIDLLVENVSINTDNRVSYSERVKKIEEKIDFLVSEVKVNGGNSLKDMLNMLMLQGIVESHSRRRLLDASGIAFWESNKNGHCIYASDAMAGLIGCNPDDFIKNGWVSLVVPEDRQRVFQEWNDSVTQGRKFILNYSFNTPKGVITVQGVGFPIILNNKLEGFVGILTKI